MKFITSVFISCLASSFSITSVLANQLGCVDPTLLPSDYDYFPDKVSPEFSSYWDVSYHKSYKIMRNLDAGTSYLLYQCGTEIPQSEVGKHNGTFAVPLQDGVAITSTTILPHFEQLGLRRQVKGVFMDPQWINSPCFSTLIDDKAITAVYGFGYSSNSPFTSGDYHQMNVTSFLEEHSDVVVLMTGDTSDPNSFIISEDAEESNQAIYEWHKVIGALFNKEALANENFDGSSARYDCAVQNAAELVASSEATPKVAWAYWSNWTGVPFWDVARCDQKNNYYCEFAAACSAEILHSNDGSIQNPYYYGEGEDYHMTNEEFFAFAKDADVFIYLDSNFYDVYETYKDELDQFKSVQNNAVYDSTKSGAAAWREQRIAEYGKCSGIVLLCDHVHLDLTTMFLRLDVVLQDFCSVVGLDSTSHERVFFRQVLPKNTEEEGNLGVCSEAEVDLQWKTRASSCAPIESSSAVSVSIGNFVALCILCAWVVSL
jgi:iron complex transport system substrate-binding protein